MELLILVAGVVLLWKFSSVMNAFAIMLKTKTEVTAEKVIGDCVEERTQQFEEFKSRMEGRKTYTNEEILDFFKVD
jgi:uncharacterized protein YlxW (UPF0749 family)